MIIFQKNNVNICHFPKILLILTNASCIMVLNLLQTLQKILNCEV